MDKRQLRSQPRYLSPQTGQAETELQGLLSGLFQGWPSLRRAYLVRAAADDQETVLLCLRFFGIPDTGLVDEIGKVFSGLFNQSQHLDVIFLRDEQERDVAAVCQPFYDRATMPPRPNGQNSK